MVSLTIQAPIAHGTVNPRHSLTRQSSHGSLQSEQTGKSHYSEDHSDRGSFTAPQQNATERSIQEEVKIRGCSIEDIEAFAQVKAYYEIHLEKQKRPNLFTDTQLFRVAHFCDFQISKSLALLQKTNPRTFSRSSFDLEAQLESQTLFPLDTRLRAKNNEPIIYMRPSRFHPSDDKKEGTRLVVHNLLYVMNYWSQRHPQCGMAFVANMNDWTMANFSTDYCLKFMNALQGKNFPVKVNLFLIVNPPSWFDKVWNIMKPMLAPGFRKKVHMIPQSRLKEFMGLRQPGWEEFLPNEFQDLGRADTNQIVQRFINRQQRSERNAGQDPTERSSLSMSASSHHSSLNTSSHHSRRESKFAYI